MKNFANKYRKEIINRSLPEEAFSELYDLLNDEIRYYDYNILSYIDEFYSKLFFYIFCTNLQGYGLYISIRSSFYAFNDELKNNTISINEIIKYCSEKYYEWIGDEIYIITDDYFSNSKIKEIYDKDGSIIEDCRVDKIINNENQLNFIIKKYGGEKIQKLIEKGALQI